MHRLLLSFCICLLSSSCQHSHEQSTGTESKWSVLTTQGKPIARHEASFVGYKSRAYLIGGRRVNSVSQYDPSAGTWTEKSSTPIELHHFQAVAMDDGIYILGAFTGGWPNEKPVDKVLVYSPEKNSFEYSHPIPAARQRGAAAAVTRQGKIYVIGGITNGHMSGTQAWFDQYDPVTGEWTELPDAPHARDHAQAAIVADKLYMVAGRVSSQATGQGFELTLNEVDVFDFVTQKWSTLPSSANLPTERAGNMVIEWNNKLLVVGGESGNQVEAHADVEVYDPLTATWARLPSLNLGRHGTGLALLDNNLYVASGSGNRGGTPELDSIERLSLVDAQSERLTPKITVKQWHTLTLEFTGPQTSELAEVNPFTDYRLQVDFSHPDSQYRIRGFYAGDGKAANSSANSGNKWQVHFSPDRQGLWQYTASFRMGSDIAIELNPEAGTAIAIDNTEGEFWVRPTPLASVDFKSRGRLGVHKGYYKFKDSDQYWLKGGVNSPENLLAYADFDDTYRVSGQNRDGEASAGGAIHEFAAHSQDWQTGDPTWQGTKGKNLIGGVNYLASLGMNSLYFLTMNINGDGKDVWPYTSPDTFDRFDVSKLAQWDIVFQHMQSKGIMLHVVVQETENELLLDGGDTGKYRKLYFAELIARFGHHPALTWNLGEENGPASWSPNGQSDQQRKDMTQFLTEADPYNHPILLHTHSTAEDKEHLLPPMLGFEPLDGLSFQVNHRTRVNQELAYWREKAAAAGNEWLITMDEIGEWHTGALNDFQDPDHDTLRQHALWGSLLAGGAGVEWYFGGKQPNNDLTSEDWRHRHNLWLQTKVAVDFFEQYLPYWRMKPAQHLLSNKQTYGFAEEGEVYVVYLPAGMSTQIDFGQPAQEYSVLWFDPKNGGELQQLGQASIPTSNSRDFAPPTELSDKDWVVLIRKISN